MGYPAPPLFLPKFDSTLRVAFDLVMERSGIRPIIAAEVDYMAMRRLPFVVAGELERELLSAAEKTK